MTSGQISSGLDLTYAPSTITTQQTTKRELDLRFESMYDDYIGGQPSADPRTTSAAQAPPVRQTPTASTTTADTAPTPTNSSSQATNIPTTSQDVDELKQQQQHVQQCDNRTKHIVVRYHFIKDHVEKGTIELYFVKTDYQLADLFTKALPVDRFNYLVRRLGMRNLSPQELERLEKSQ
ncbi:hypothetical protein Tco_0744041 [Tanacetum coccineum]